MSGVADRAQETVVSAAGGALGRSRPADLAEHLRAQIHSGVLGPGDRLPNERDLAAALGVGRITVREAIRTLVQDGYVVSKRGNSGGTFVSDLTAAQQAWTEKVRRDPDWAVDLIEYRKAVEIRAAELAAHRASEVDLAEMTAAIEQGTTPATRSAFRAADHLFHVAMASASGSTRLVDATVQARGELFVPVDLLPFDDHYAQTREEHGRILEAIRAHDPAAARRAVEEHLDGSLRDFMHMVVHGRRDPR
jgi:GntR family transcriptional regulator, transcriptional repressor for pyruvate dehydrogenase complex